MANESELPINVVIGDKPKMPQRLEPKGKWSSERVTSSCSVDVAPPAKRLKPIPTLVLMPQRGKPVLLPSGKVTRKRNR